MCVQRTVQQSSYHCQSKRVVLRFEIVQEREERDCAATNARCFEGCPSSARFLAREKPCFSKESSRLLA